MRKNKDLSFLRKQKSEPIAIVADGKTEAWYLAMLKQNEDIKVKLVPELPQKKGVKELYDKAKELAKDYDTVIWIVDLDTILEASRKAKRGAETPFNQFLKYKAEIDKVRKVKDERKDKTGIHIIINQPCMEYWLLCHFEQTTAPFTNCGSAETKLKKQLNGYKKSEDYYKNNSNDIYKRLKKDLPKALAYSRTRKTFDASAPNTGYTEMHKLFAVLGLYAAEK